MYLAHIIFDYVSQFNMKINRQNYSKNQFRIEITPKFVIIIGKLTRVKLASLPLVKTA